MVALNQMVYDSYYRHQTVWWRRWGRNITKSIWSKPLLTLLWLLAWLYACRQMLTLDILWNFALGTVLVNINYLLYSAYMKIGSNYISPISVEIFHSLREGVTRKSQIGQSMAQFSRWLISLKSINAGCRYWCWWCWCRRVDCIGHIFLSSVDIAN